MPSMTGPEAFQTLDLRVGRVWIDFGPLGEKSSSAQLNDLYRPEDLVGRLVVAAVNLGERNIAGFPSQALVLGLPDEAGRVVLLAVEREVPLGGRVY